MSTTAADDEKGHTELGVVVYVPNEKVAGPRRVLVGLPKVRLS